ncbi:MAG: M13 family metallopeptidase [Saccharofermentans sp.]|nr:M13 family metallopeptidase [Saccharofermentans sp.]
MKSHKFFATVLVACMCLSIVSGCTITTTLESEETAATETQEISFNFTPGEDFYGYINGETIANSQIGFREGGTGTFYDVHNLVEDRIEGIIDDVCESSEIYPENSGEAIIASVYSQYVNYDYSNPGEATAPLFEEAYQRIENVNSVEEYVQLMGEFYRDYGITLFLVPSVSQNIVYDPNQYCVQLGFDQSPLGESLENYSTSYYLDIPEQGRTTLRYWGVEEEDTNTRVDNIVSMFVDIARNTDFDILEASYAEQISAVKVYTFDEMDAILSNIDLEMYFTACGATEMPDVIGIGDCNQFSTYNEYMTDENLQALKDYAKFNFVGSYSAYLPSSDDALRNALTTDPTSEVAIHDMAIRNITSNYSEIIGDLYTKTYGDEEIVEAVQSMCDEIIEAYRGLINGADWISDEGRALLLTKLNNIVFKIGGRTPLDIYPEYDGILGANPMATEINLARIQAEMDMANINQPYDRMTFGMTASTVNACYNTDNTVTIPYGIINAPFFDINASRATNLGGLGSVIAHEISHGFDSDCISWNSEGVYDPTWTPQSDLDALQVLMDATIEYYSNYTVMDVYYVDGELTLGENFADLGGVQAVLTLVKTPEEYRDLFTSYAINWCGVTNNESALSSLTNDVHSPDYIRVNAVVSSCDEFYEAYDVEEGDNMYVAPENRINRW